MNAELASLLANKADGEAQVTARMAIISGLTGDEAAAHKEALAREQAALDSISATIESLQSSAPPAKPTKPKKP